MGKRGRDFSLRDIVTRYFLAAAAAAALNVLEVRWVQKVHLKVSQINLQNIPLLKKKSQSNSRWPTWYSTSESLANNIVCQWATTCCNVLAKYVKMVSKVQTSALSSEAMIVIVATTQCHQKKFQSKGNPRVIQDNKCTMDLYRIVLDHSASYYLIASRKNCFGKYQKLSVAPVGVSAKCLKMLQSKKEYRIFQTVSRTVLHVLTGNRVTKNSLRCWISVWSILFASTSGISELDVFLNRSQVHQHHSHQHLHSFY